MLEENNSSMEKITLERDIMVPRGGYCIRWKHQDITCPQLNFRKDARKPKIKWNCAFFDEDLVQNINAFGIKKYCKKEEEHEEHEIVWPTFD